MSWFVLFAASVFGLYFWRQYRERQLELNSPLADHRLGLRHIGDVVVLELQGERDPPVGIRFRR